MPAGADGARGGLLVATDAPDGALRLFRAEPAAVLGDATLAPLLVDVPIGLPERGVRTCDVVARRRLGPRRASVFPAPLRPMLAARSYAEALALGRARDGRGLSRQAYQLLPLVRAVDAALSPACQHRIREGHPELSFALLAGGPLAYAKHTVTGRALRLELLSEVFPDLEGALRAWPRGLWTDVLDACALLWSARRWARGEALVLPDRPETDARGLRMEIVA